MNILIIGGGGREHALAWKIADSPLVKTVYCTPGNAGIADISKTVSCVSINIEDNKELVEFVKKKKIDFTIVGPEVPLANGVVDYFQDEGFKIFGPNKNAAQLEASKSFAKNIMNRYNIPTAKGEMFTAFSKAQKYITTFDGPVVVKADGLAAGKGVFVCKDQKEALTALELIMKSKVVGDAGSKVIIEECLKGEEVSFLALTDGKTVLPLPSSQDYKTVLDNDKGANTGGMGAYSPSPIVDDIIYKKIMETVMIPTVQAMKSEGYNYKGVLYAGLMINKDQIKVLEFNVRFGDPETQPLMMRIQNDIIPLLEATTNETLHKHKVIINPMPAVCVVMASKGYPGTYKKNDVISGLNDTKRIKNLSVFHAGTALKKDNVISTGGRVLGVTALGDTIDKAMKKAYLGVSKIKWENEFHRNDIAQKVVERLNAKPTIGIVMGSDSDMNVMAETIKVFKKFGISYEVTVASAHRTPKKACDFALNARTRGMKVIIAGAGHAAHLAGVLAAHTTLPVIGIPIDSSALSGFDSLLSTVQMPPGVPVATVAVGKPGAVNAAILAIQMLGISDLKIEKLLEQYKLEMMEKVEQKANNLVKLY